MLGEAYLPQKLPQQSPAEREQWVEETTGFTFAALSELIIAVHCMGAGFAETIDRLRNLDAHNPSSQEFASEFAQKESPDVFADSQA